MITENKKYARSTGSWFSITTILAYLYHLNYLYNDDISLEIFYDSYNFDKNFKFDHWEQEETFLEQFNYIKTLCLLQSDYNNKIDHVLINDNQKYRELKKIYADDVKKIHETKYGTQKTLHAYGLVWPLKNTFTRKANKVCAFIPPETVLQETGRLEARCDWNYWLYQLNQHYDVYELDYRLPIRDVVYHLSTCEFSIGCPGVAQSLSICLSTPTLLYKFKNSPNENYEHFIPLTFFDMVHDKSYIDKNVKIAKERIKSFLLDFEFNFGD